MKRVMCIAISLVFILTGCSKSENAAPTSSALYVPSKCADTKILSALPSSIPNPKFIDTEWQPAENTDLYAALNAGGIACTFGFQTAEIGTTILWAPDDDTLFTQRSAEWLKAGYKTIDIPGVDEKSAYVLTEGKEGLGEYHVWIVNLLIDGIWIQVNATFTKSIDEMVPLIKAAINSLRDEKKMAAENVTGCYAATLGNDLLVLKLDQQDRNLVFAKVGFYWSQKDSNDGSMIASYRNGVLTGIYNFKSSGTNSQRELFFKGDKSGFNAGVGAVEVVKGVEQLKRPLNLKWDESYKYVPSDKCS